MFSLLGLLRRKKKPQTEEEMLADAFAGVKAEQEKKARIRRKKYRRLLPDWLDRRILIGLGLILCAFIADGVRRENEEFYATATRVVGTVQKLPREGRSGTRLEVGDKLEDRNVVRTGQRSRAVLEFPDASVVTVGPNTYMVVKMLQYSRGGKWRGRSFFVKFGQIWARVSPHFGKRSEMRVYTPSSVAAVRGTTFSVYQAPRGYQSTVYCTAGSVEAMGFRGRPRYVQANTTSSILLGQAPEQPEKLAADQQRYFRQKELTKEIPPEHWLKNVELTITQVLDMPLTILGLGKTSWGVGCADFARRTVTKKGLQLLHVQLEGSPTYPEFVNPATLEQLGIRQEEVRRILSVFYGDALELYRQLGDGRGFIVFARSKDKRRSLFKLTAYGPAPAEEDELKKYR